jgi:hypothetical protein
VVYSADTGHGPGGTEELPTALRRFAAFGVFFAVAGDDASSGYARVNKVPLAEFACAVSASTG